MKFIYKSIYDEIVDECMRAELASRTITSIQVNRGEYFQLMKEGIVPKEFCSIAGIAEGPKGLINGIPIEVKS